MPKSKRAKIVHVSKTHKNRKELSKRMYLNIQECIAKYPYLYVFSFENMRNKHLKDVRAELSDSRIILGRTKVSALALSTSPQFAPLLPLIKGTTGLLFSLRPPSQIRSYLATFHPTSFARAGTISPLTFVLPSGALYATGGLVEPEEDVLLPHTLEPVLRNNGVPTRLVKGKIMLESEKGYTICRKGEVLGATQAALLKAFGVEASLFRVIVMGWWGEDIGCHVVNDDGCEGKKEGKDGVLNTAKSTMGTDTDNIGSIGVEVEDDLDKVDNGAIDDSL